MTRDFLILSHATEKAQLPVDRQVLHPVTVSLLKLSNGAPILHWGTLDWSAAKRLSAALMNQHCKLSHLEAAQTLDAIWTPISSLPPAPDFTDAEAILFFRAPLQSMCSIHGRWIESVATLSRVRLELKEITSDQPFSVCFFYIAP